MIITIGLFTIGAFVWLIVWLYDQDKKATAARFAKMSPEQLAAIKAYAAYGPLQPQMVCPHCQNRGSVHTQPSMQKQGISGGKATAAILTGGTSLLLTGLSKTGYVTQAHCVNCNCTWTF
jgi:hypothetical protein